MNDTQIIYKDIIQEIEDILEIVPNNANLLLLLKATEYFKANKDALMVIRNGITRMQYSIGKVSQQEQKELL